jgi:opacity protein-like surface antigen
MSNCKLLVLASVAAGLSISAANAADLMPPPPPIVAPAPAFAGWYLRGNIGFSNQQVDSLALQPLPPEFAGTTITTQFLNFNAAPLYSLGAGYRFNNWFRVDATGEYRAASSFHGQQVERAGAVTLPDDYTAQKTEWLFLANAYVDLGTWWCITPFVGAGIGTSRNTISNFMDQGASTSGTGGATILSTTYFDNASKWNFAWALYAGLGYQVTPGLTLEMTYRYVDLGKATTGTPHAFDGTPIPTSPFVFNNITSNDVMIGMRWNLGEPIAPVVPLVRKG